MKHIVGQRSYRDGVYIICKRVVKSILHKFFHYSPINNNYISSTYYCGKCKEFVKSYR